MEYRIKDSRNKYYLKVNYWVLDTFDIDVLEGILYTLISSYEPFIWTADYIAAALKVSKSTVLRMVRHLEEIEAIKKIVVNNGSKNKWLLIALYDLNGKRDLSTIEQIAKEGKSKLQTLQKKNYKILRKTISKFKENNDPLDILIENLPI